MVSIMWWFKEHSTPVEKWAFYPWYKALKYATYTEWKSTLEDSWENIQGGFTSFWSGVFALLLLAVQWVFSPILKPIEFIKRLPRLRRAITDDREKNLKEWQARIYARPE